MHNLEEIQSAVSSLPMKDFVRFRQWFLARDADEWDREIESDVQTGRLDFLAEEALDDYRTGKIHQL